MRGTPPRFNATSRARNMRGSVDRHAGQLQRQVAFDGRIHLRRAAVIDVPAAVRQLHRENVIHRLALPLGIHFAVPMVVGDHVRHQRRIHHQLADPVALGLLLAEQIPLRPLNCGFQFHLRLEPEVLLTRALLYAALSERHYIHTHTLRMSHQNVKELFALSIPAQRVCMKVTGGRNNRASADLAGHKPSDFLKSAA